MGCSTCCKVSKTFMKGFSGFGAGFEISSECFTSSGWSGHVSKNVTKVKTSYMWVLHDQRGLDDMNLYVHLTYFLFYFIFIKSGLDLYSNCCVVSVDL